MDDSAAADWQALGESLGQWWRDAGVDLAFEDAPRDWLEPPAPPPEAEAPHAAPPAGTEARPGRSPGPEALARADDEASEPIGGPRETWPATLDEFAPWWLSEPSLDDGNAGGRVAPGGPPKAPLMVLVTQPEREDRGFLLSGPEGALLDAMLRAMGLARDEVYLGSALARHTPAAHWRQLAERGLGAVLRHHVALAAPERLCVFGRDALGLLAPERFDVRAASGALVLDGAEIPLLAGHPLSALADRPQFKAGWWRRYLAFTR